MGPAQLSRQRRDDLFSREGFIKAKHMANNEDCLAVAAVDALIASTALPSRRQANEVT